MHEIIVRSETPEDIRAIDVVHLSAFEGESEAQLLSTLRGGSDFDPNLSLVAELNGRIVGHVLLSKVSLEREAWKTEVLALGPMAVVPSQSHRGIGVELINAAVTKAREYGTGMIVVAGHPDYYTHCGFVPATDCGLTSNLSLPDDALTVMELVEGSAKGGGTVHYPEAFQALF